MPLQKRITLLESGIFMFSYQRIARLGRTAAMMKAGAAPPPMPPQPNPFAGPPAAPNPAPPPVAVPPAGAGPVGAAGIAGNAGVHPPAFSAQDLPEAPVGQRTMAARAAWKNNAMLTHAYKNLQGIGLDAATNQVKKPYDLNANQMQRLSHYMNPRVGEQFRLNKLQRRGRPSPYGNQIEYNQAMKGFLGTRNSNRQAVIDRANEMYGANIANIPKNTLTNLQGVGQRSLQPPTPSFP